MNFTARTDSGDQMLAAAKAFRNVWSTIVRPDAPIVIGFPLGILAVFVVQEVDHFVQHRFGYRKARAEGRACKVKRKSVPIPCFVIKSSRLPPSLASG